MFITVMSESTSTYLFVKGILSIKIPDLINILKTYVSIRSD